MSNQGGTQSPPLQGRENDPIGQVSHREEGNNRSDLVATHG